MANSKEKSVALVDEALATLSRLRTAIVVEKDPRPGTSVATPAVAVNPSHVDVEGHSWGSPALGFSRVTLSFQVHHRYTFWSFNFWKFAFSIHVPSKKARESGNDQLAEWLADERERTFEATLANLLAKKKRQEAIQLVRDVRNLTTKQAMEFVDNRVTESTLTKEHLSKLNENVKVNDRIVQEYKEMGGDLPLQAR